jgi:hypothetical protein
MIRLKNRNPFFGPSLLMLTLSSCVLSQAYAREDFRSPAEQEVYINKLKKELLQIKKDLVTLEPNKEKSASAPEVSHKTFSSSPTILKRSTAISTTKEDLRRIRKGLFELQGGKGKQTEPVKQEPSLQTSTLIRKVEKIRQRNNYFLFVNPGIAFAQDLEFALPAGNKAILGTRNGLDLSIAFGRQFGSWSIGSEIGFRRIGYKNFILPTSPIPFNATGDSTSYSFALCGGRDFSVGHFWNLHAGLSLGVANRHETFTLPDVPVGGSPFQKADDGPRIQGSVRIALEYAFSDLCSTYLGYRFTYLDDLREFDSMPIHQAQLGMRWNL